MLVIMYNTMYIEQASRYTLRVLNPNCRILEVWMRDMTSLGGEEFRPRGDGEARRVGVGLCAYPADGQPRRVVPTQTTGNHGELPLPGLRATTESCPYPADGQPFYDRYPR